MNIVNNSSDNTVTIPTDFKDTINTYRIATDPGYAALDRFNKETSNQALEDTSLDFLGLGLSKVAGNAIKSNAAKKQFVTGNFSDVVKKEINFHPMQQYDTIARKAQIAMLKAKAERPIIHGYGGLSKVDKARIANQEDAVNAFYKKTGGDDYTLADELAALKEYVPETYGKYTKEDLLNSSLHQGTRERLSQKILSERTDKLLENQAKVMSKFRR